MKRVSYKNCPKRTPEGVVLCNLCGLTGKALKRQLKKCLAERIEMADRAKREKINETK